MAFLFDKSDISLLQNFISAVIVLLLLISLHAYGDANRQLRKTEDLYNSQPRTKRIHAKLKWPARIISFITFKR